MDRNPDVSRLHAGDVVAVVIWDSMFRDKASEIASVRSSGPLYLKLSDGRTYSTADGVGFGKAFGTRIRPATICERLSRAVIVT